MVAEKVMGKYFKIYIYLLIYLYLLSSEGSLNQHLKIKHSKKNN